jgi:hypothetical protein
MSYDGDGEASEIVVPDSQSHPLASQAVSRLKLEPGRRTLQYLWKGGVG